MPTNCFNPRPPLLAGDPFQRVALPWASSFQSAPAIAGGRSARSDSICWLTACFNPRPPLLAGDPLLSETLNETLLFQSAPAIAGGRSAARPSVIRCTAGFQSAPAIAGGRSGKDCVPPSSSVRFNPRPPLLAGDPSATWPAAPPPRCFNPRPPLLAGDPSPASLPAWVTRVSIRARHCWRAIPPQSSVKWDQSQQFQSAPAIAGGRSNSLREAMSELGLFQSAPAIAGGRSTAPTAPTWSACSFNPRPPLLAGDPVQSGARAAIAGVSIRARHCWRAIRATTRARGDRRSVSIRARHCWRAIRIGNDLSSERHQFQSAPAIAGGRSEFAGRGWRRERRFNPRPPLLAGDPAAAKTTLVDADVSIRARHCWRAIR